MDAADTLMSRLSGAVIAEEREHLAPVGIEAHVDKRLNGPEALLRAPNGEYRLALALHWTLPPCTARTRPSRWLRSTSASTATKMIRPMAII